MTPISLPSHGTSMVLPRLSVETRPPLKSKRTLTMERAEWFQLRCGTICVERGGGRGRRTATDGLARWCTANTETGVTSSLSIKQWRRFEESLNRRVALRTSARATAQWREWVRNEGCPQQSGVSSVIRDVISDQGCPRRDATTGHSTSRRLHVKLCLCIVSGCCLPLYQNVEITQYPYIIIDLLFYLANKYIHTYT